MGIILLTSTGLSSPNVLSYFKKVSATENYKSAAIITTAAEGKAENKYAKLAKEQLQFAGLKTVFVDLAQTPDFDFLPFDVIYVCGGDTFNLLAHAKRGNFRESIKSLIARKGCYVGVSAGSLILCPRIDTAEQLTFFKGKPAADLSFQGLAIINFSIIVHYVPLLEKKVLEYEYATGFPVHRIGNSEAIVVSGLSQNLQQIA